MRLRASLHAHALLRLGLDQVFDSWVAKFCGTLDGRVPGVSNSFEEIATLRKESTVARRPALATGTVLVLRRKARSVTEHWTAPPTLALVLVLDEDDLAESPFDDVGWLAMLPGPVSLLWEAEDEESPPPLHEATPQQVWTRWTPGLPPWSEATAVSGPAGADALVALLQRSGSPA